MTTKKGSSTFLTKKCTPNKILATPMLLSVNLGTVYDRGESKRAAEKS